MKLDSPKSGKQMRLILVVTFVATVASSAGLIIFRDEVPGSCRIGHFSFRWRIHGNTDLAPSIPLAKLSHLENTLRVSAASVMRSSRSEK